MNKSLNHERGQHELEGLTATSLPAIFVLWDCFLTLFYPFYDWISQLTLPTHSNLSHSVLSPRQSCRDCVQELIRLPNASEACRGAGSRQAPWIQNRKSRIHQISPKCQTGGSLVLRLGGCSYRADIWHRNECYISVCGQTWMLTSSQYS
ncbi:hypothetical protein PAXRUDRAFT_672036 [Paxillus rubicundulus Ve08.2h10]|uniref:Uncharacterized protein n=1 Tax=Paxillus rubicundulus Ve08.2h10 TaxID=930991 RepID=A0A0D0D294_9AGAM|nr:hypothetical protein PAXRUDRAFT_672036 [Paxillus rubicundulus Ve08.2h10]